MPDFIKEPIEHWPTITVIIVIGAIIQAVAKKIAEPIADKIVNTTKTKVSRLYFWCCSNWRILLFLGDILFLAFLGVIFINFPGSERPATEKIVKFGLFITFTFWLQLQSIRDDVERFARQLKAKQIKTKNGGE